MESTLTARTGRTLAVAALALAVTGVWLAPVQAQDKPARIVCWKDKSGKVVGCGDKVPLEFQDSAQREMDRRGVTRSQTDSAEEVAKRRAQEQDAAQLKQEEAKRVADQRRQDAALLNTFSSDKEIDQKRDRDLQQLDLQLSQLQVSLKNATERYNDAKSRSDAGSKEKKTADMLKEDMEKTAAERKRLEQSIAAKEKEKEDTRKNYAEQKKRYVELRGGDGSAVGPPPASATEGVGYGKPEAKKAAATGQPPARTSGPGTPPAPRVARQEKVIMCGRTTIVCDAGDTVMCGGKQLSCQ